MTLLALPDEVIASIALKVSSSDRFSLILTCRQLLHSLEATPTIGAHHLAHTRPCVDPSTLPFSLLSPWDQCSLLFRAESALFSGALSLEVIRGLVGDLGVLAEGLREALRRGDDQANERLIGLLVKVHGPWLAGLRGSLAWRAERPPEEHLEACLSVLSMVFLRHARGELTRLLDGIAEEVRRKLPRGDPVPDLAIVGALNDHLFNGPLRLATRAPSFVFDSPTANLPVFAIWSQPASSTGNPVCLSVVMHLLLWRLGVKSELASLPRHFMLYLPCDNGGVSLANNERGEHAVLRDPFHSGRPVDGPMIVLLTGTRLLGPLAFLSPLSCPALVINRMLNNIAQRASQWETMLTAMVVVEAIDKDQQPELTHIKEKLARLVSDWDEAVTRPM
jgi:hypothetical protein